MLRTCFGIATFVLFAAIAAPASAQATRTWVSGVGDDVNPCSRTAPCKTFAGAISKTAAGGEINCLDPGGFGTVTITKSLTIDCSGTFGSQLASSTNGITVNDGSSGFPGTIRVILRGLTLNGAGGGAQNAAGNTGTGLVGINFISGASLYVEDVFIQNFNSGNATGIRFAPTGNATLTVVNSTIISNGTAVAGGGVAILPGVSGSARVTLSNVTIANNGNAGFSVSMGGSTGSGVFASLDNVVLSRNGNGITGLHTAGASGMLLTITNSTVSNNLAAGIQGNGTAATMRVGNTTISGNATGVNRLGSSTIESYGDNRNNGNTTTDGTFSSVIPKV